ncbi:MAG TPA: malonyl-ACP O-methyltransferase BioC [Casimicrobiaceae bacterium]|nr:malonyl-ACP O-methyltransferase BioC [Casimicrobiaceae bacterium]
MGRPASPVPDPRDVDPIVVKRAFGRAARSYDAAAVLQREIGRRMLARLDVVKLQPGAVLDAGCGTGEGSLELAARYPNAQVVGFDLAWPMVSAAGARASGSRSLYRRLVGPLIGAAGAGPKFVCADLNALPFRGMAFDLAMSNLALQWVNDLPRAFAEMRRCLKVGGLLMFSTLGPDTLKELRAAFAKADAHSHVNRFIDLHDIGDMLVDTGYADPVMDMEIVTLTYPTPAALMRELKALGATNATRGRPRGLMGRGRFMRAVSELDRHARDGRLPATFEIVYGHAWKGEPKTVGGLPVVGMPKRRG